MKRNQSISSKNDPDDNFFLANCHTILDSVGMHLDTPAAPPVGKAEAACTDVDKVACTVAGRIVCCKADGKTVYFQAVCMVACTAVGKVFHKVVYTVADRIVCTNIQIDLDGLVYSTLTLGVSRLLRF